jgi:hypothetical protein
MLMISFNIKGLGKTSKQISLGRIMDIHKPFVMIIQETMGEGKKVIEDLYKSWKEWDFLTLDVAG